MHQFDISVKGKETEILKLTQQVKAFASDPMNFVEEVEVDKRIEAKVLADLKTECSKKFGIVDIKLLG